MPSFSNATLFHGPPGFKPQARKASSPLSSTYPETHSKREKKENRPLPPRRNGPPSIWNPLSYSRREKSGKADFDVYQTEWPKDSSELSGKTVALYFDREEDFPFLIGSRLKRPHRTGQHEGDRFGEKSPLPIQYAPSQRS